MAIRCRIVDEKPMKLASPNRAYPPNVTFAARKLWLPITVSWQIVVFDQMTLFAPNCTHGSMTTPGKMRLLSPICAFFATWLDGLTRLMQLYPAALPWA